jgi:hypothetical protein
LRATRWKSRARGCPNNRGSQAAATFDTMTNVTLGLKKNNQPTDAAFSTVDPLPIWPQTTAIFKERGAIHHHVLGKRVDCQRLCTENPIRLIA